MELNKQMELFEDGGLRDEGGMIDETSGNDVPTGSTREEVRDDIPAQLSEGEFVLPADVVRFHGLEKIMELRDEAKAGLAKMEDMGQMGNSEEATLPDDMPFSLEDLDMEDEPQEMAEGGYVMVAGKPMPIPMIGGQLPPITTRPNEPTKNMAVGGMITPSTYQVPTNIASQPSYFQNYAQSTAPFQPFQPQTPTPATPFQGLNNTVGQNTTGPSFSSLMPQLTGKRETKEYRNAAGQKLFIPFISGKPIYPIPEGYTLYVAEAVKDTTPAPTSQSTSVRQEGGESSDPLSGTTSVRGLDNSVVSTDFSGKSAADVSKSMGNMNQAQKGASVLGALQEAKGYTGFAKGMQQFGALMTPGVMQASMYGQKTTNPMDVMNQIGKPNPSQLNAITAAYGYDITNPALDDEIAFSGSTTNRDEALSMAVFGMSLNDAKNTYGVTPSFQQKNEPGSFSPTGGFYDIYGSSSGPNGHPEFTDVKAFTNNFKAMGKSKTGFTGKTALDTINDPNASDKAKENANRHLRELEKITGVMPAEVSNARDKAAVKGRTDPSMNTKAGRFSNMKSGYGIGETTGIGSQNIGIEDVDVTSLSDQSKGYSNAATGIGNTSSTGAVGSSDSSNDSPGGGLGGGGDQSSSDGSSSDAGGATEGVGDYNIGGLAGKKKKKPKPKKMKRGGLASR